MEPLIQHKYIRFIAKKEGEREMTKKEKEIFRRYLDYSCTEMVRCMSDSGEGRTESAVASAVFVQLQGLWNELNKVDTEQGA